jgi:UDP-glucose 4-epimerase
VRAIVTGGAGFIGSHLVEALLERGDDVLAVDDLSRGKREQVAPGAELAVHDVRDPLGEIFAAFRPEICFHLAAQADVRVSVARPVEDASVNVVGSVQVLHAAQRQGTKIVFASTGGAIYGECPRPAKEDDPLEPLSPYGAAKLATETYLFTWNRLHGSHHAALRFANVYGPRQEAGLEGGVVAIFFEQMSRGEQTTIYGSGRQTRDFVHVGDIVSAMLAAADAEGVFNVGSGIETSILDLHDLCRRVAGKEAEPELAPERLGEIQRSVLDPSLAERGLGWAPARTLEEGLRETWEWFKAA